MLFFASLDSVILSLPLAKDLPEYLDLACAFRCIFTVHSKFLAEEPGTAFDNEHRGRSFAQRQGSG